MKEMKFPIPKGFRLVDTEPRIVRTGEWYWNIEENKASRFDARENLPISCKYILTRKGRVDEGEKYFFINESIVCHDFDDRESIDDTRYEEGNYFHDLEEAGRLLDEVMEKARSDLAEKLFIRAALNK